jgi:hypothetical protein
MVSSERCVRHATRYLRMADRARTLKTRKTLLAMAASWLQLAIRAADHAARSDAEDASRALLGPPEQRSTVDLDTQRRVRLGFWPVPTRRNRLVAHSGNSPAGAIPSHAP